MQEFAENYYITKIDRFTVRVNGAFGNSGFVITVCRCGWRCEFYAAGPSFEKGIVNIAIKVYNFKRNTMNPIMYFWRERGHSG